MKMGNKVRKALLRDIEEIADNNILMAKETENKIFDKKIVIKGVKAVIEDPNKGFYLVAEEADGKKIVGQLMITFEWSDWRNKFFWWIQSLYVNKEYRNRRIFTGLYKELVELTKSRENVCGLRLYVEEHNESAKKIYETLGMKRTPYEIFEVLYD